MRNQAKLAALGRVSLGRASQIMEMLNLGPDIQDVILFLERAPGRDRVAGRSTRAIVEEADWRRQRDRWGRI